MTQLQPSGQCAAATHAVVDTLGKRVVQQYATVPVNHTAVLDWELTLSGRAERPRLA